MNRDTATSSATSSATTYTFAVPIDATLDGVTYLVFVYDNDFY